jgi:hypothetical protein
VIGAVGNTVVGLLPTVSVTVRDQYSNQVPTASGTVRLVTTGSAGVLSGGGLITISNGAGSVSVTDIVAEMVTLSLADPSPVLQVTSTQTITFAAGSFTLSFLFIL